MAPRATAAGRYLYCVGRGAPAEAFGSIGIGGAEVYGITHCGLSAVLHDCPAEPYVSRDESLVRDWALAHQRVVEIAGTTMGDILPCRFNTIIKGDGTSEAESNLRRWLEGERGVLEARLSHVRGKSEYGVQIFWQPKEVAAGCLRRDADLRRLNEGLESLPEGTAYLHRVRLEGLLRERLREESRSCCREFYGKAREYAADIRVGSIRATGDGRRMIMNLSCLLEHGNAARLHAWLESIEKRPGFSTVLSGPWPPYSFS